MIESLNAFLGQVLGYLMILSVIVGLFGAAILILNWVFDLEGWLVDRALSDSQ
ncbi:MAG: hypothetical protein FWC58_06905 [Desulfobulbus sp.]|nr:hypothetical protein [Desulfobulbus sp.]